VEELALQIIEALPTSLRRLTADLTEEQLHRRPAPGQWSIVEITGHLIDKTEVWGERFRHIATQNQPSLPAYDQDAWVRERGYQSQPFPALAERLGGMLVALAAELRVLPADAWQRIGLHEERGYLTLAEACRIYAISLPEHVAQLVAARDLVVDARPSPPPLSQ
jgi:hypothetical protein